MVGFQIEPSCARTNVAIHVTQTVHKTGLFRWMRHPSYSGMLLIFTAIGLSQRNWVSLAIMLVFPTAALLYRIHVEEMALTEGFGEDLLGIQPLHEAAGARDLLMEIRGALRPSVQPWHGQTQTPEPVAPRS